MVSGLPPGREGIQQVTYHSASLSPQIGFLLSIPRLPFMVEASDFEIEGLDFMVSLLTSWCWGWMESNKEVIISTDQNVGSCLA